MNKLLLIIMFSLTLLGTEFKNSLQYETSPYLKQHASNPVKWMPWGETAFKKAKEEGKAVFLSIGYSTCHWCHVMAKEAFENEEVAKVLNEHFICIKVDKEEMPHLDTLYQEIYLKVKNRSGGWPLNAFLTSQKKPFYITTYIPLTKQTHSEGLDTLLPRLAKRYKYNFKCIQEDVKKIAVLMKQPVRHVKNSSAKVSAKTLLNVVNKSFDDIYSGFGHHKKFPEVAKINLMLDLAILKKNEELEKKVLFMLDSMALRGLYDHVEGGFYRYSVDRAWEIPHFEKMLYNQAELIPLYTRAYLLTGKKLYKNIVIETIAMVEKKFERQRLFLSASDADTNHEEGAYFLFTPKETKNALLNNPHKLAIEEALEFSIEGNFKGKVHLNFYTTNRPQGFSNFRKELLKIRAKKEYPFIDKKVNTAWNAMMIEALYKASLLDTKYAKKAEEHLKALTMFMFDKGELYHQSIIGFNPKQLGLLEDYSFMIGALISGYETTLKSEKLDFAEYLLSVAKRKFYRNGVWYLSDDSLKVKADLKDKYYTSALGKMAQNIVKLASLKASFSYEKLALQTLESINAEIEKKQFEVPAAATAFMMQKVGVVTLKSSKKRLQTNMLKIQQLKYPYVLIKAEKNENYIACTMRSCFAIEKDFSKIKKRIESYEN